MRDGSNTVSCWGLSSSTPKVVTSGGNNFKAVQLAVGQGFACGLLASPGGVACWGNNFSGKLGNGQTTDSDSPVNVLNLSDAIYVGAGDDHACAVRQNGQVLCWGANQSGQLGIGQHDTLPHAVPQPVNNLSGAARVHGTADGTCAEKGDGHVVCWGAGAYVGSTDGISPATIDAPTAPVSGLLSQRLAMSSQHACAVTPEYKVVCWGQGFFGELGNNAQVYSSSPVAVLGF